MPSDYAKETLHYPRQQKTPPSDFPETKGGAFPETEAYMFPPLNSVPNRVAIVKPFTGDRADLFTRAVALISADPRFDATRLTGQIAEMSDDEITRLLRSASYELVRVFSPGDRVVFWTNTMSVNRGA